MTFAEKLRNVLKAANLPAVPVGDLRAAEWLKVVQQVYEVEKVAEKKQRKPPGAKRERNLLWDALALATGTRDLAQVTRNGAKEIGVALADIQNAMIASGVVLTVEEIHRRAEAYKRRWTDPRNLSASALAKNWGKFATTSGEAATLAAQMDVYQEPPDWFEHAVTLHGKELADRMKERGWMELGTDFRAAILRERVKHKKGAVA